MATKKTKPPAAATTDDDDAEPSEVFPGEWLPRTEATKLLGESERKLYRLCSDGAIERRRVNGTGYFSRQDILDYCEMRGSVTPDETNGVSGDALTSGFAAGTHLVKQASDHADRMFRLFESPVQAVLQALSKELERLRDENAKLQDRISAMVTREREYLDAAHEREAVSRILELEQRRKDKMLETLKPAALGMAQKLTGAVVLPARLQTALELLTSLDPDILKAVLADENDMLTPEQKTKLRTILEPA